MSTAHSIALPRIGQHWAEQGGIFIGLVPGQNGESDYALIASDDDRTLFKDVKWGDYEDVPGAASEWDGLVNTVAMAEAGSDLAQKILTLNIDGRSDFYLPARHELRMIKLVAPQLIVEDWHWSSTQYSAINAWCQGFDDGFQSLSGKDNALRARAVRRFLINLSI